MIYPRTYQSLGSHLMSVFDTTGVRSWCYATGFDWNTQDALFICALNSVPRWMQAFPEIRLPCSGTREEGQIIQFPKACNGF